MPVLILKMTNKTTNAKELHSFPAACHVM